MGRLFEDIPPDERRSVDLLGVKVGDRVRLRNGTVLKITAINGGFSVPLLVGSNGYSYWQSNGRFATISNMLAPPNKDDLNDLMEIVQEGESTDMRVGV